MIRAYLPIWAAGRRGKDVPPFMPVATVAYLHDDDMNFEGLFFHDSESGDTLEIQRSIELDEQDAALGMDTYCILRDGASHYGGIVGWATSVDSVSIELVESAQKVLALPAVVRISVDAGAIALIEKHLPVLCAAPGA